MKTIQCKIIHDVSAPNADELNGQWHNGERLEHSETVAFYHRRKWFASNPGLPAVAGPFANKALALLS